MVVISRHALRHIDHATDIFVPRPQGALSDATIRKKVSKGRFVERINARNLSTTATPLMRYVSQLRRKHTSLYVVLKLSIFKTMNACNGVVKRPADDSWLIAARPSVSPMAQLP